MADLGAIGLGPKALAYSCQLDVAAGWNITNNPIVCREITSSSKALPKREDWKAIEGVIRDGSDAPAARIVRVLDRATGKLLAVTVSSAVDGSYSVLVPSAAEVQRIVLDDDAGTLYNDLIDRVMVS